MAGTSTPARGSRRFYEAVSVEEDGDAFAVRLDGRTPRTPEGQALAAPSRALAELIANEWRVQAGTVDHSSMPLTRLAHTALDVVSKSRGPCLEEIVRYAGADLLCYFAERPASLVGRQREIWGSLLDWASEVHGLAFAPTSGIVHRDQRPETLAALARILEPLDDFTLAGLAFATALFGSAILALALRDGRIDVDQAMVAARLDEIFQAERWGLDAEAATRAEVMAVDAAMVERWFAALRPAAQVDKLVTRPADR